MEEQCQKFDVKVYRDFLRCRFMTDDWSECFNKKKGSYSVVLTGTRITFFPCYSSTHFGPIGWKYVRRRKFSMIYHTLERAKLGAFENYGHLWNHMRSGNRPTKTVN